MYQNVDARAERLFLLIKPIALWRSRYRKLWRKLLKMFWKTFDGVDKLSKEQAEGILHFIRRNGVLAVLPSELASGNRCYSN